MDLQNFTHKSLEAIQKAQSIALENNCMQIEEEHLAEALLQQEGGLISQLLTKMGLDSSAVLSAVDEQVKKLPSVTGPGREPGKIYISSDVDAVLADAENQAKRMKDEYVSVEHIMLSMIDRPNSAMQGVFSRFGITRDKFLAALSSVRGNTRVTDRKSVV